MTTADTAKELHLSRRRVLQLVEQGDLLFELTRSGQYIYRLQDVRQARDRRADAAARSKPERLQAVRCRMLRIPYEPQQLSLWPTREMRLVRSRPPSESALRDRVVNLAESPAECAESEKRSSVNRKAGSR